MPRSNFFCAGTPRHASVIDGGLCGAHPSAEDLWRRVLGEDTALGLASVTGDFALAIEMYPSTTVLAVDRFAIQPLCYRIDGDGSVRWSANASDLADSSSPIDPQAIYDYLYFHCIPSPRTIYKGVYRVPAGHAVVVRNGHVAVMGYWRPQFDYDDHRPAAPRFPQFRSLVRAAVERGLDDAQAACFLSGGTDSSTIVGMVAEAGRRPVSYSIGFDAAGYDEMAYARVAAKHFGAEHHEYYVTPADLVRGIPTMAAHLDQPFGNSSVLPAYYCARMARDAGAKVILAGDGGDELFGGNARYAKQKVFGWYGAVPAFAREGMLEPLLERTRAGSWPVLRKGRSYVEQAKVPMPGRLQMYNLLLRLGPEQVLSDETLAAVDLGEPLRHQQATWDAVPTSSELNRTLAFDWRYTLAESDLPKVRYATSLAGIGVRFPFLDSAVLDFSTSLPPRDKLRGLRLRWFFKEALRGFLPDEIISKPKHGFGLPFGPWLLSHAELRELAIDAVRGLARRGVVRERFVEGLFGSRLAEHPGYYGEMVWILMMLELWIRAHEFPS